MRAFEHATVVLKIKDKALALTRKDVLAGITDESAERLARMGAEGWEMVSAIPFSSGANGLFSTAMKTDCALAFFKREKA